MTRTGVTLLLTLPLLAVLAAERIGALAARRGEWWRVHAESWGGRPRLVLYDEAREVLTRAVCEWPGCRFVISGVEIVA